MAARKAAATQAPPGLGTFMAALRAQESGGNYNEPNGQGAYQIIQSNWPGWAKSAGYKVGSPNASAASPAIQDAVAKWHILQYYYGPAKRSWYKVARAWNGGAGCIDRACRNTALDPSGKDGVGVYADQVMAKMKKLPPNLGAPASPATGAANTPSGSGAGAGVGSYGSPSSVASEAGLSASDAAVVQAGGVPCYVRTPSIPLGLGVSIPSFCIDGLVFGVTALIGVAGMAASLALIGTALGLKNPTVAQVAGLAITKGKSAGIPKPKAATKTPPAPDVKKMTAPLNGKD